MMTVERILKEAIKLPEKKRNNLARAILSYSDEEDEEFVLTEELKTELEVALKECDAHPERMIPWEEIERELDEELKN